MKRTTQKESEKEFWNKQLEEDKKFWRNFGVIFFILWVFSISFFVAFFIKSNSLEQQLFKCQEQVPVWTLRFVCSDVDEYNKVTFEQNFTNYEDYRAGLELVGNKEYKLFENCEVLD